MCNFAIFVVVDGVDWQYSCYVDSVMGSTPTQPNFCKVEFCIYKQSGVKYLCVHSQMSGQSFLAVKLKSVIILLRLRITHVYMDFITSDLKEGVAYVLKK